MNTTAPFLALPATLLRSATNALPSFSFVQVPHIKLKAEHQALVLFHIVKIALAYWSGWRDAQKNVQAGGRVKKQVPHPTKATKKSKRSRVVGRGKYTVIFQ